MGAGGFTIVTMTALLVAQAYSTCMTSVCSPCQPLSSLAEHHVGCLLMQRVMRLLHSALFLGLGGIIIELTLKLAKVDHDSSTYLLGPFSSMSLDSHTLTLLHVPAGDFVSLAVETRHACDQLCKALTAVVAAILCFSASVLVVTCPSSTLACRTAGVRRTLPPRHVAVCSAVHPAARQCPSDGQELVMFFLRHPSCLTYCK